MSDVPDGQVPRDAAFWRTYNAVRAEEDERWRRDQQWTCEHKDVRIARGRELECDACGADRNEVLAQYRRMGMTVMENEDGIALSWSPLGSRAAL